MTTPSSEYQERLHNDCTFIEFQEQDCHQLDADDSHSMCGCCHMGRSRHIAPIPYWRLTDPDTGQPLSLDAVLLGAGSVRHAPAAIGHALAKSANKSLGTDGVVDICCSCVDVPSGALYSSSGAVATSSLVQRRRLSRSRPYLDTLRNLGCASAVWPFIRSGSRWPLPPRAPTWLAVALARRDCIGPLAPRLLGQPL